MQCMTIYPPTADMIRMYEQGASLQEIADHCEGTAGGVAYHLRKAGVARRPPGLRPGTKRVTQRVLTDAQDQEAAQMYRDGAMVAEVAEKMGVSHKAATNALVRQGVTFRDKSEAATHARAVKDARLGPRITSRWHDDHGYVALRISRNHPRYGMTSKHGRVLEHRLVMAESLGRDLLPNETVHHINGVRDDNRLENLQLRQGKHGNGVRMRCCDCGSFNVEAATLDSARDPT